MKHEWSVFLSRFLDWRYEVIFVQFQLLSPLDILLSFLLSGSLWLTEAKKGVSLTPL